jgi:hypothetical protein
LKAKRASAPEDAKTRFRLGFDKLGVVGGSAGSVARVVLEGRIVAEVRLAGQKWEHGVGVVQSAVMDARRRRVFLLWSEVPTACCVGPVPVAHDQVSIVPLPPATAAE